LEPEFQFRVPAARIDEMSVWIHESWNHTAALHIQDLLGLVLLKEMVFRPDREDPSRMDGDRSLALGLEPAFPHTRQFPDVDQEEINGLSCSHGFRDDMNFIGPCLG